jgi:hypothetical protein
MLRNLDKKTFHCQKHQKPRQKQFFFTVIVWYLRHSCADAELDHLRYINSGPQTPRVYPCYNLLATSTNELFRKFLYPAFSTAKWNHLWTNSEKQKELFRSMLSHSTTHARDTQTSLSFMYLLGFSQRALPFYILHDSILVRILLADVLSSIVLVCNY